MCKVVKLGKTFLRHLYQKIAQTYHYIRFNVQVRSDLMWWALFIHSWNGVSILREYGEPQQFNHEIWTDASGMFGYGALWGKWWLQASWSKVYKDIPCEVELL